MVFVSEWSTCLARLLTMAMDCGFWLRLSVVSGSVVGGLDIL